MPKQPTKQKKPAFRHAPREYRERRGHKPGPLRRWCDEFAAKQKAAGAADTDGAYLAKIASGSGCSRPTFRWLHDHAPEEIRALMRDKFGALKAAA